MWSNASVAIVHEVLHVVVTNQTMSSPLPSDYLTSPPFPLPLTRIRAVKFRKRGGKILIKMEPRRLQNVQLKGPKKLIFVFHGTSKEDESAAMGLYEQLFVYSPSP